MFAFLLISGDILVPILARLLGQNHGEDSISDIHLVSFEHIGVYDWWPGGASDAGAIHHFSISAFKQGNSFALLQKKYTKIYILHGQLGNIMQLSLRLRNRFLSSSLPGLVVIFWIPGFALLAEIQVGNELLACGLK